MKGTNGRDRIYAVEARETTILPGGRPAPSAAPDPKDR